MTAALGYRFALEGREYHLDRIRISEWEAMQRETGKTIDQFGLALALGDPLCIKVLVWLARRRDDPKLRIRDVDFVLDDFAALPADEDDEAEAEGEPEADASPGKGRRPSRAGRSTRAG